MCCAQLGELLRLLQLMSAVHSAARGGSKLWGTAVDSRLRALSASLRQQGQQMLAPSASQAAASQAAEVSSAAEPGTADAPASALPANTSSPGEPAAMAASVGGDSAAIAAGQAPAVISEMVPQAGGTQSDDVWAEIEDKIRRQGGVIDGGDSRARLLRQSCLTQLKDMIAPLRGKRD